MGAISSAVSQFNAADLLWVAGAIVLVILAIKVAAKILKFLLGIAVIVAVIAFLMSAGIIPKLF